MLLWCDELGLQAFAANHEFMNSQYEINVKHSEALDAADRAFMLRAAVKEIAVREGLLATFMGRPFADQGGSGFHVHLSLAGDGRAQRVRRRGRAGRAQPARGPVHRRRDRARPGPAGPARPDDQRLQADPARQPRADTRELGPRQPHRVLPRARASVGSRARVEIRTGDGSACAHLITAALLLAGLDGIERELDPPEPVVGDAYRADEDHAGSRLPVGPRRGARRARGRRAAWSRRSGSRSSPRSSR